MKKEKTAITKEEILSIEKYAYELQRYSEQAEVLKDISIISFNNIVYEINYIKMVLNIYENSHPGSNPIAGLCLDDVKKEDTYLKYWFFSSPETAGEIIGEAPSKIILMCEGKRTQPLGQIALKESVTDSKGNRRYKTKGWKFLYKEEFDMNPDNSKVVFSPASSIFKLKTIKYSDE